MPRVVGPALSNYEDSDMLDVLGHCFTDPMFQSLLRFPDGTELTPSQFDELLTSTQMESVEEVELAQGRPVGSVLKLLSESMLERERDTGLSSVMGPEMCLTTEEKNRLTDLFNGQVSACRDCMPVRLVAIQHKDWTYKLPYYLPFYITKNKQIFRLSNLDFSESIIDNLTYER